MIEFLKILHGIMVIIMEFKHAYSMMMLLIAFIFIFCLMLMLLQGVTHNLLTIKILLNMILESTFSLTARGVIGIVCLMVLWTS